MAARGDFHFTKIKKIYVISILNGKIYKDLDEWHHIGCMRNQHGEFMSDEITQIVVELRKWNKKPEEIVDDIDKLIYLMKMTHKLKVTDDFIPPEFLNENWIQEAIHELRMSDMDPVQRTIAEREIVKTVHHLDQIKARAKQEREAEQAKQETEKEKRKAEKERQRAEQERQKAEQERQRAEQAEQKAEQKVEEVKQEAKLQIEQVVRGLVVSLLGENHSPEYIAATIKIPIEQVLKIQQQINKE